MITETKLKDTPATVLFRYLSIKKTFAKLHGYVCLNYFDGFIYTSKNAGFYIFSHSPTGQKLNNIRVQTFSKQGKTIKIS
jgi:hypothetical protein